jgi:Spy/CpxP family protein refolding chaperone
MSRKYGAVVLIGFLGAILLASAVQGQDEGPPQGRRGRGRGMMGGPGGMGMMGGPGGMGMMGVFGLLRNEKIQQELKLTEDQITKLEDSGREFFESMRENFDALQNLSPEERRAKTEELSKEIQEKLDKKLGEILEPKQLERLDQIQLQLQGPMALMTEKVSKALELTDEQKEKIQGIREESMGKMREFMEGMRDLSREERQEKMGEMREKMEQMRTETGKKMLEVLTKDQKEKFDKMKGEKIDIDLMDLFPRRGRGGPGGPGGPGGQGGPPPQ